MERVVRFIGYFASQAPPGREDESLIFCEALVAWLLSVVHAKDKTVRARACQLMSQILNALPEDAGLEEVRELTRTPEAQCICGPLHPKPQTRPWTRSVIEHAHPRAQYTRVPPHPKPQTRLWTRSVREDAHPRSSIYVLPYTLSPRRGPG